MWLLVDKHRVIKSSSNWKLFTYDYILKDKLNKGERIQLMGCNVGQLMKLNFNRMKFSFALSLDMHFSKCYLNQQQQHVLGKY